jgi:hypothetical protein
MNKRQFDLAVGVTVGVIAAFTGVRLWATRYLIEGKATGPMHVLAEVSKAVTG